MKRISILAFALVTIFAGSGCLKDKGFENEEYGGPQIKSGPGSDAVSFPEASKNPLAQSLEAIATAQVITTKIHLEADRPAAQNIVVTLTPSPASIPAGVTAIPAANYSIPATVTIPAGAWSVDVPITITGANTFNPSNSYGLALSISNVTAGYIIASNLKTLVYTFAIKNKYDGLWRLKGVHNRAPYTFPYNVPDMELRTKTANSVEFWWRSVGDVGHPIGTGPGQTSWYGNTVAPVIVFNTTTDLVTSVFNQNLAAGGPPIDIYSGAGSGQGRFVASGPDAIGGAKTIYVYWRYNANDLRGFMDTLIYLGPR